jgi:hypothetical protein
MAAVTTIIIILKATKNLASTWGELKNVAPYDGTSPVEKEAIVTKKKNRKYKYVSGLLSLYFISNKKISQNMKTGLR